MTAVEARVSDLGIGFSTPEGLPEVVDTGDWDRPEQLLSTAKQDAHDHCLLDTPEGGWLSERQVISAVSKHTQAFVGETPEGPQVFLVAPSIRSRYGNEGKVPMSVALAREYAIDRAYLRAVRDAAAQQLIGREEAVRQAGGTDPVQALDALEEARRASADARSVWNLSRNQTTPQPREVLPPIDENQDSVRELALAAAQATQAAIPAGMVGVGVALAGARRRDEHGRRFRTVGSVVYRTAAAIAVGSMVISACTSVQTLRPPQVVEVTMTPMPEQFSPQLDQAKPAVALWVGMRVPLAEGEFGMFPNQAIFEVDPTDSTGQTLKTLSLLNPDGKTTDPDMRYAMGLALVPSEKTGEAVELPFLVQLGKNGEALMLGMFLDPAQSTEEVGVFRLNIAKDGRIRPVTQEMVVTNVAGGVTVQLRDVSDPNNIVTYHLVSTPKVASFPSQQSVVPSEGADNQWIEKVVAFMSGAEGVQAAEPATPEQLASATPLPPEPTETLEPPPVVSDYLSGARVTEKYDFNSNRLDGWSYSSTTVHTVADGTVQLNGEGSWGSASLNLEKALEPGTAVVLDIRATNGPMELYMDSGTFGDAAYRRVGIHIQKDGLVTANIFEGAAFLHPALSGTLKTLHPEKWYRAMFAVASDGTVRLVMWDRDDPTKQLQYHAAYPELIGKSMKFAAGVHTGVLTIDEADVLAFTALSVLPEVPVQATLIPAQPTQQVQPTTVLPAMTATSQPEQPPPAGGYNFADEGTEYVCRKCPFTDNLINSPNLVQIILTAGDSATGVKTFEDATLTPAQFLSKVQELESNGYRRLNMTIYQGKNIGDPTAVGMKPNTLWFFMIR